MQPESNKSSDPVLVDIITPYQFNQIFERFYPVGSIYSNKTDTRNPAQIFGFGTWVLEEGKFLVGKAASGTFNTLGATGGAETVTLTEAQMPSHKHDGAVGFPISWVTSGDRISINVAGQGGYPLDTSINNTGGGGSHPNLPPYRVVNIWVRTA